MTTADEMGLTPEAAQGYEEFFIPAIFHQWPPIMIETAGVGDGDDVLDVGCGTGVLTREMVRHVGAAGSATGLDLSESMLGVAREQCPDAKFRHGNAMDIPFEDQSFDAVISAFMLMFVPQPEKALSEMLRVLKVGGRMVVSVWHGLEHNVVYRELVEATREVAGDDAAQSMAWPFVMGAGDTLESVFRSAQPKDVTMIQRDGTASFSSVEDFVTTEIQAWLLADNINSEQIDAIAQSLRKRYAPFQEVSGAVSFPLNALIARGVAAA